MAGESSVKGGSDATSSKEYFGPNEADEWLGEEQRFVLDGEERPARGFAISGGGIRSAAFSMGVLQALVAAGRFREFDYLSTVSGGGYTGSALTWWLHRGLPTNATHGAGVEEDNFPFGSRRRQGEVPEAQNAILNFIRQQASYLSPTPRLDLLSSLAVVFRSAFLSLLVYFSLLTGLLGLLLGTPLLAPQPRLTEALGLPAEFPLNLAMVACGLISILLAVLAIFYVGFIWAQRFRWIRSLGGDVGGYRSRTTIQVFLGWVLRIELAFFAVALLTAAYLAPKLHALLHQGGASSLRPLLFGAFSTLIGSILGLTERKVTLSRRLTSLRALVAISLALFGLLLGALTAADNLRAHPYFPNYGFYLLVVAALLFGWASNTNYLGLHRMYRDRLMELFLPEAEAVRKQTWLPAVAADHLGIHQVCGVVEGRVKRPYHLINTNVVLVNSESGRERVRGGDSFLLSPLFIGSHKTGWQRSNKYMNADSGGRGMTLPSAMSISGAALNPNTAVAGRGLTRSMPASIVLSLLNVRLGYWAPNPSARRAEEPNFIRPGILSLLGLGHTGRERNVELTDGGHFENLGVYELLRRRVSSIVVCDGGEDADYLFGDLANAIERARVDFGVKISFSDELGLDGLVPGSGPETPDVLDGKFELAARPFAEGVIRYPDGSHGRFVYLKSTLFPGLPIDVLGYKLSESEFPHQSTGDQFFDELQFEAYRELGYHAGWKFVEHDRSRAASPAETGPGRSESPAPVPAKSENLPPLGTISAP